MAAHEETLSNASIATGQSVHSTVIIVQVVEGIRTLADPFGVLSHGKTYRRALVRGLSLRLTTYDGRQNTPPTQVNYWRWKSRLATLFPSSNTQTLQAHSVNRSSCHR